MIQILQLDVRGMPQDWITPEDAATYYATDSVAWTVGSVMPLLFTPYAPSVFEGFSLAGCNIRGDVHDWLISRVGSHSRWTNPSFKVGQHNYLQ